MKARSISFKITFVILGLLFLIHLLDIWQGSKWLRSILLQEMEKRGNALARSSAIFSIEHMAGSNYPELETYCENIVRDSRVALISITREEDSKVVARFPRGETNAESSNLRLYEFPITFGEEDSIRLGSVTIALSTLDLERQISTRIIELLVTASVLFACCAGLMILFLNQIITRPLARLDRAATRLGDGQLESPISTSGNDEISRLSETLEGMRKKLRNSYRSLQTKNDELEELGRIKDDFLANMSHEIRTPMNGVLGMVSLLLDTELTDEQREYAEAVRGSGDTLLTLINDILDFSKIQAGKLVLESVPFDLQKNVEDVASLLAPKARDKNLEFAVRYAPDCPRHVVGDPVRVRQVLTNLVGNALKFTRQGHVMIDVECVESDKEEATIRLAVKDTGVGIAPEKIDLIFEQFTQVDSSVTRQFGGTGLGLAISKRLVELMKGDLDVQSEIDKGSEFAFAVKLPLDSDALGGTAPEFRGVRALVVDDNIVKRRVMEEQLASWRMTVESVETGQAALRLPKKSCGRRETVPPRCHRPLHARDGRGRPGSRDHKRPAAQRNGSDYAQLQWRDW